MKIFDDASLKPFVFCWFGEIPEQQINEWLRRIAISLPRDLLAFWARTAGGDVFESETILRPPVTQRPESYFTPGDDTDTANRTHHRAGMPSEVFLFEIGAFRSAVVLKTQRYVTLREDYSIGSSFDSFDDWYRNTLRLEFAARYGLEE